MINKLKYDEIAEIHFWVVPDAGSFMLSLFMLHGKEMKILITQAIDLVDYTEEMIPGRIYIDDRLIDLNSEDEKAVLSLLFLLVENNRLGHKEGLAVVRAREIIQFFNSAEAERIHRVLNDKIQQR